MYVKKIKLKNFRNYDDLELDFNEKVNIFVGDNAQGKTNLLEAIYFTSIGRSFRTNKYNELVKFDRDFSRVYTEIVKKDFENTVEILSGRDSKKYIKLDGVKIRKTSELLENLHIVIFSPEDLKIVKDEPERRRKFIDRELCQINPSYYDNLGNYKKILLQRNNYLKENYIDPEILDIWDLQLSKYGKAIIAQRREFIEKINLISKEIHGKITDGKEALNIIYEPNVGENHDLYEEIKKSYSSDIRQRTTTKGPHKDDLEFFINGINVRSFGSQGQQRTAALSLKLAEISIIEEETGELPILLLDDVMSELDSSRQEFLIKSLERVQLFITNTEISDKISEKFSEKTVFLVKKGKISILDSKENHKINH